MARSKAGAGPDDQAPPNSHLEVNSEDLEVNSAVDGTDFADFFGDGLQPVIVELYRDRPKYVGDVKVHGFLETLPPGVTMQYVKDNYGGGQFRVVQKAAGGGTMQKQRYFDIAGPAYLPAPPVAVVPSVRAGVDSPAAAPAAVGMVEGVPITGNLARDMEVAKSFMLMKKALGGDDLNTQLLQLLLTERNQQKQPDMLSALRDLGPIISTIRELVPGGEGGQDAGGAGFNDLIKEGLKTFAEYLKTARAAGPRPALPPAGPPVNVPRQIPLTAPPPAAPALAEVENPEIETPADQPAESENDMPLTPQGMIDSAVQSIVQSYRLGKPVDRVVTFLNSRVPLSHALRQQYLASRKDELFDTAEMILDQESESYADDLEGRGKFKAFFDSVFDQFLTGGGE